MGTLVSNQVSITSASAEQQLLTSTNQFLMLDRTNVVSYQNISILFNTEPPVNNDGNTYTTTVYQFAHGYTYQPYIWAYGNVNGGTTIVGNVANIFLHLENFLVINEVDIVDLAWLTYYVDTTNVYIQVNKVWTTTGSQYNPYIAGNTVNLRCYVFVQNA